MEDFVTFEIAVKLKEKGFTCKYPIAMYNEDGEFYPLYTSTEFYYCINDFDEHDFIAPTISQVLKWLRKEKQVDILIDILIKYDNNLNRKRQYTAKILTPKLNKPIYVCSIYNYEKALIRAIEYYLDNLI